MGDPLSNGSNGRGPNGKFLKGNPGGPGNPAAPRVQHFRNLMVRAVSDEQFLSIFNKLVASAETGDLPATREVLDRLLGKPKSTLEIQQEAQEEAALDRSIAERLAGLFPTGKAGPGPATGGHGGNGKGNGQH